MSNFDHQVLQIHGCDVGGLQHNDIAVHDADVHQVIKHYLVLQIAMIMLYLYLFDFFFYTFLSLHV